MGAARPPRRDQADEDLVPGPAEVARRSRRSPARARSRPRTKVLHFCHITNLTGQIFPVKQMCDEARRRGVRTVVDGAHAFAHFPYKASDLGCDYYGTSLHKWLLAPIGTGFLYVRRENIAAALAADAGQRVERRTTSASSRRSARTRPRTTTRSPRRSTFHRRDRQRAQGRAPALPARSLGDTPRRQPEDPSAHKPGSGAILRHRHRADHRRPDAESRGAALGALADHRDAPIVHAEYRRRAHHAERLHDDRGGRHLRGSDGRNLRPER